MTRWLSSEEQVAWRSFLFGVNRLLEHLDHSLQEHHGVPLTDYEILVFLSEAPRRRLRMSELADQVLVSRSKLTYRVDRLVERGLVVRSQVAADRRGLYAELTDAGMDLLDEAARTHVADVRDRLMDHIPPDGLAGFSTLWRSVANHQQNDGSA